MGRVNLAFSSQVCLWCDVSTASCQLPNRALLPECGFFFFPLNTPGLWFGFMMQWVQTRPQCSLLTHSHPAIASSCQQPVPLMHALSSWHTQLTLSGLAVHVFITIICESCFELGHGLRCYISVILGCLLFSMAACCRLLALPMIVMHDYTIMSWIIPGLTPTPTTGLVWKPALHFQQILIQF